MADNVIWVPIPAEVPAGHHVEVRWIDGQGEPVVSVVADEGPESPAAPARKPGSYDKYGGDPWSGPTEPAPGEQY